MAERNEARGERYRRMSRMVFFERIGNVVAFVRYGAHNEHSLNGPAFYEIVNKPRSASFHLLRYGNDGAACRSMLLFVAEYWDAFPSLRAEELQPDEILPGETATHTLPERNLWWATLIFAGVADRAWAPICTSYFDLDRKVEWIGVPSSLPSQFRPQWLRAKRTHRGASGVFGPTEAGSLRIELEFGRVDTTFDYGFRFSRKPLAFACGLR